MGTPAFMAPEQVLGPAVLVGPHTDVYALGVTLYQLACGQLPFRGDNHALVFRKLVDEEALPLHFMDPTIPVELEAIVQRCMEKDIFRRYDSALDLAEDLRRFLDGEPVTARPHSFWRRSEKKFRRNSVAYAAAGLALLLGTGWVYYARQSSSQAAAMQVRLAAQDEDLVRARAELGHLREAQLAERTRTEALQKQVAEARTPVERREAEEQLKESQAREQALAARVAKAEQRPLTANPLVKAEPPPPEATQQPAAVQARAEPEPAALIPPQMVRQAPMNYPYRALNSPGNQLRNQDVKVLLQVQVDAQGQVQDVRVETGVPGPWGYNEAAVTAVRASTFAPAQRGGQPVAGSLPVTVMFKKVR
jgi:TonB family protein